MSRASGHAKAIAWACLLPRSTRHSPAAPSGSTAATRKGPPTVDFNLLADTRDTSRMIEAARFARALLLDPEVGAVTTEPFILPPNPPIRLLSRPGLQSRLLNDLIAATLSLGSPLRRAALRHALAPGKLLADILDDAEFDVLALASATPMFHPAGTCAMGLVADAEGRVLGAKCLRVVDACIMPKIPRGNTNLPTQMVAGKCAATIIAAARSAARPR
jgi:5-(hydroxymethyl)furfural/furfural oxidase